MNDEPVPLLDVYDRAWEDYGDVQMALRVVGGYLEDLSSSNGCIPWGDWFRPQSQAPLELLCKRLVLDDSQRYVHPYAWSSMAHWRVEMLLDPLIAPRLRSCVEDVPEKTWHDLFHLHGHTTALTLTRLLGPTKTEPGILEHTLMKRHKGIVLALHLGMFTNESLGSEQGLHGQSLDFWAKRVGVVASKEGWEAFCTMYPWAGPMLVHFGLQLSQPSPEFVPFIASWSQRYPLQSQALQTYLHAQGEFGERVQCLLQPTTNALAELQVRQQIINSLYPPAASITAFMDNYQRIFVHPMEASLDVELPCLELHSN